MSRIHCPCGNTIVTTRDPNPSAWTVVHGGTLRGAVARMRSADSENRLKNAVRELDEIVTGPSAANRLAYACARCRRIHVRAAAEREPLRASIYVLESGVGVEAASDADQYFEHPGHGG
ncbi:MAG TPA: hypothetical protein VGX28_10395 [Frankiaceae bacterium]|jgi:hypothetical protein|nr:hypothetical protein [Frankiaceae bacterium]